MRSTGLVLGIPNIMSGNVSYRYADDFDRADGAIGNGWEGSTWTISSNKAMNTPTRTPISVTNASMELDANWTNLATPVTNERSNEQAHTGTYSRKVVSDGLNDGCTQGVSGHTIKRWYEWRGWLYVSAGSAIFTVNNITGGVGNNLGKSTAAASWVQALRVGRATNAAVGFNFKSATAVSTLYADDAEADEFTLASLMVTRDSAHSDIAIKAKMSGVSFGKVAGIVFCLDSYTNPQNFLIAYHNGDNILLEKCVSGTYTTLFNLGVVYSDDKEIKVVKSGTKVQVFYDDAQVGADQTLTDAILISGTRHGLFSTHSDCKFDDFVMSDSDQPAALPTASWEMQILPQYLAGTPAILLRMDDFQDDAYYVVHEYLKTKHARATFYVATGLVDTNPGTYVTWWMLRVMERYGWSIGSHTRDHTHLNVLSQADAETAIANGQNDLLTYNLRAARHFSYPYGEHDAEAEAAARAVVTTAMTIDGSYPDIGPGMDLFTINNRATVDSSTLLATMTGIVDYAKAHNKVAGFLWHTVPGDISIANFQALVDYAIAQGVPFVTIEDIYNSLSGPISVPVPIS